MQRGLLLFAILFFLGQASLLEAKIPLFFGSSYKILKVADFPNGPGFKTTTGENIDLGYHFEYVHILFIPVWCYEEKWCGYVSEETYVPLDSKELDEALAAAKMKKPSIPSKGIWYTLIGKILVAGVAIFFILARGAGQE